MRRILLIVNKPTITERAVQRGNEKRRNSDHDGSKWPTRPMVGLCDGVSSALTCAARCPLTRQRMRKTWCKKFDGRFYPVRSQSQQALPHREDEAGLHQSGNEMSPGVFMGTRSTRKGRIVKRFARRGSHTPREPVSLRSSHQWVQAPGSRTRQESCRFHVLKLFDLLQQSPRARWKRSRGQRLRRRER